MTAKFTMTILILSPGQFSLFHSLPRSLSDCHLRNQLKAETYSVQIAVCTRNIAYCIPIHTLR